MKRVLIAVRLLLALGLALGPGVARAKVWSAGGLSFSDELGGFRLISVSGHGTTEEPIVIVEELTGIDPAVLVIRGRQERAPGAATRADVIAGRPVLNLAVIKIVLNGSRRVWGGFDLELQERRGTPSPYGDGLSFDQTDSFGTGLSSDRFALNRQLFEPYDRVRFQDGSVDPGAQARFRFFITDPTPVEEFYLIQEPRILMAGAPKGTPRSRFGLAVLSRAPSRRAAPTDP